MSISCEWEECSEESVVLVQYKDSVSAANGGFFCETHLQNFVKRGLVVNLIKKARNPYLVPDWRDIEKEWAKTEDVPELYKLVLTIQPDKKGVRIHQGFAYKTTTKYLRRMPIGIYESRKRWGKPKGYWETRDAVKKNNSGLSEPEIKQVHEMEDEVRAS